MNRPGLIVDAGVIRDTIRQAALEVPGVVRVGRSDGPIRRRLGRPAVIVRLDGRVASVRVTIVARPGRPLQPIAAQVRGAVAAALERQLGLIAGSVVVTIDGVGA